MICEYETYYDKLHYLKKNQASQLKKLLSCCDSLRLYFPAKNFPIWLYTNHFFHVKLLQIEHILDLIQ